MELLNSLPLALDLIIRANRLGQTTIAGVNRLEQMAVTTAASAYESSVSNNLAADLYSAVASNPVFHSDLRYNPHEVFARAREQKGNIYRNRGPFSHVVVLGHDECRHVLTNPNVFSSRIFSGKFEPNWMRGLNPYNKKILRQVFIAMDGEEHSRIRDLVKGAFSPRANAGLDIFVHEKAEHLATNVFLDEAKQVDVYRKFARQLPILTLGYVLGIEESRMKSFPEIVDEVASIFNPGKTYYANELDNTLGKFYDLLDDTIVNHAEGSVMENLVVKLHEGTITLEELRATAIVLMSGGYITTSTLMGNVIVKLLQEPDLMEEVENFARTEELRDSSPKYLQSFIEEVNRMEPPIMSVVRVATEDTTVSTQSSGEVTVEKGDYVLAMLAAANRDPKIFDNPDEFALDRKRSLSFGLGVHSCIGARLAGLVTHAGVLALLEKGSIALVDEPQSSPQRRLFSKDREPVPNLPGVGYDRQMLINEFTNITVEAVTSHNSGPPPKP